MGTNERFHSLAPSRVQGANGGFRQLCASALTHPVTVAALAILLLNDVLFKSLWPDSWVTGKLSDLAWMVFAPPLLAFLLSFLTRRIPRVERASWLAAYVGLPLLYAAFNTFEPVHYWILQGLSVASGGTAGSPLDVTDSLVIPFGWVIAIWVWRQRVVGPATQRLRWGLLVAGVAALASVATSPFEPDHGVTKVGVSADGTVHASDGYGGLYQSRDGGYNWTERSSDSDDIVWGDISVDTPRGLYVIRGSHISFVDADGRPEPVYSTAYLRTPGNVWVQKHESGLQLASEVVTRPLGIVYGARSGNLIVAMGRQGVVVGTPDGRWERFAVGRYSPTNFSFAAKTRLLLSRLDFWALAVALSLSMTGAAQLYSRQWGEDRHPPAIGRRIVMALLAVLAAAVIAWILSSVFLNDGRFVFGPIGIYGLLVLAPFLVGTAICTMPLRSKVRRGLALSIGTLSVIGSCIMLLMFGGTSADDNFYPLYFSVIGVPAFTLGITAMAVSCPQPKYWPMVGTALMGMIGLVVLAFMLWLHLGIALFLAKVSAFLLTALLAYVLAGYLRRKTAKPDAEGVCPRCQHPNSLMAWKCYNCELLLYDDKEI